MPEADEQDCFAQAGYDCRFAWGREGVVEAAAREDILVIVDVLSFSSAVATAIERGCMIYPFRTEDEAIQSARTDPSLAVARRRELAMPGEYSLSPLSFAAARAGDRVALPSPNGATCCRIAGSGKNATVLSGCLLNARAVAEYACSVGTHTGRPVTVVACGERWNDPGDDGQIRFAIEDYLGAGAILSYVSGVLSPEAEVCVRAFAGSREIAGDLLWNCGSGMELRQRGYGGDVTHSARINLYASVPMLSYGRFAAAPGLPVPQ